MYLIVSKMYNLFLTYWYKIERFDRAGLFAGHQRWGVWLHVVGEHV